MGDIITVLVSEATLATATKSQSGSDQQTRKNDLGINPPKIGTTALPSIDADMSMDKNASSKQSGDAKRNVNFKGDISVRVVARRQDRPAADQGHEGRSTSTRISKRSTSPAGSAPRTSRRDNYVTSERVADAQLTYALTGDIGKTRGGIIGRLLNVFWP